MLASFTDVSVFAANVITMLGLGMAIDYALFVVSRFREELAAGHDTPTAIGAPSRRPAAPSWSPALTVALALSSLLLFPMDFLKSMAYGGMAAVLVAMLAALTALPALLAVLGPRINALRVPLPRWRRATADAAQPAEGGWARLARSVMRRPVLYLVGVSVVLLALAAPFLRASFGGFDERVLPAGTAEPHRRRAARRRVPRRRRGPDPRPGLRRQPAGRPGLRRPGRRAAQRDRRRRSPRTSGDSSLVAITYDGEPSSAQARDVVRDVRALPAPAGAEVLVGGRSAADLDQIDEPDRPAAAGWRSTSAW